MSLSLHSPHYNKSPGYRYAVDRAIKGKNGQQFFLDLVAALEAMPTKELISGDLIDADGRYCALGAVCASRGFEVSFLLAASSVELSDLLEIAEDLVKEILWQNDEGGDVIHQDSPVERWQLMYDWAKSLIVEG